MWNKIKNDNDIKKLMEEYSDFHDSCIVSISYSSGAAVNQNNAMTNGSPIEHALSMILHSQWYQPIELLFKSVRKFSVEGWNEKYSCNILDAYIAFHTELSDSESREKLIVWADGDRFDPVNYNYKAIPKGGDYTYVVAGELWWRIVDNIS